MLSVAPALYFLGVPRGKKKLSQEQADKIFRLAQFTPLEPYTGSADKRRVSCDICGMECFVTYSSVARGSRGCPTCRAVAMREALRLEAEEADAVFRAAGLEPLEPYVNSKTKRRSRCLRCGTIGHPQYQSLRAGNGGCKPCGYEIVRQKLQAQKTNLAAIDALFHRANLTPLEPWVNANTPRLSRCNSCGREARIRYSGLWNGQGGCRPCAAKERGFKQRNSGDIVDAVFRKCNLEPLEPYLGTDVKRRCRCTECGAAVDVMYKEIASGKRSGCRYCAYKRIGIAKTLSQEVVDALFLAKDLEPLEPYEGSSLARRCRCMKCGREVNPMYSSLKQGQGGCKYCAPVGLQRAAPGLLYLMRHDEYFALKVGVTSTAARKNRVRTHQLHGWSLVKTWDLPDAGVAESIETVVLGHWRQTLNAPPALLPSDMPSGGHSETVALIYVTAEDAASLIDQLVTEAGAEN